MVWEGTHRNWRIKMANLLYRGAEVVHKEAVKSNDHIASYRGTTYNTKDVEAAPKATSGNYRGSSWEA